MELSIKIQELSSRIQTLKENVLTEEATKHSFIMPFISALGYDIFNPMVVVPEFTADISKKKNEKVDYAIMYNNKPLILIEAKSHTENLDLHATQLERYFTVTESRFAILTNGIEYRFFTDLEKPNKMDTTPFFTFNILAIKDRDLKELEKFTSANLDIDKILASAENKKYVSAIKSIFKDEVKGRDRRLAQTIRVGDYKRTNNGVLVYRTSQQALDSVKPLAFIKALQNILFSVQWQSKKIIY